MNEHTLMVSVVISERTTPSNSDFKGWYDCKGIFCEGTLMLENGVTMECMEMQTGGDKNLSISG